MHNFQCVNFIHSKWLLLYKVFHSRFLEFICTVYRVHCTRLLRVHFMRILSKIVVCLDFWFSCKILRSESLSFHAKNHLKRKTMFYSSFDEYTFKTFIFSTASNVFKYFITPIIYNVWRNFQLYTTIRVVVPLKTDYPI